MNPNKASFFKVEFRFNEIEINEFKTSREIESNMDLVLQMIQSSDEIYRFTKESKLIYLFSTKTRKREGQLLRLVNRYIYKTNLQEAMDRPSIKALLKKDFYEKIKKLEKNETIKNIEIPEEFPNYNGSDVKLLEDKKNWHPWQIELHKKFFYKNGEIKKAAPDDRKIYFLYDPKGCSGKSTFFKWLLWKNTDDIGYLTSGTASQLRSALSQTDYKNMYLCDLPRSLGAQDSLRITDLMGVIEELKSGTLMSIMYGKNSVVLQDKSHIIISSNQLLDPNRLSKDRLEILQIDNKKIKDITKKTIKYFDKKHSESKKLARVELYESY